MQSNGKQSKRNQPQSRAIKSNQNQPKSNQKQSKAIKINQSIEGNKKQDEIKEQPKAMNSNEQPWTINEKQ